METKKLILTFLIAIHFFGDYFQEAHCLVINQISKLLKMKIQCPKESMIVIAIGIIFYVFTVFYVKKKIYSLILDF